MTIIEIEDTDLFNPGFAVSGEVTGSVVNLDATGEKWATVFTAPETGSITHVDWATGSSMAASTDVDIRIETVSSGQPSGTLWSTTTNGAETGLTTSTRYSTALTSSASVSKGDKVAIVCNITSTSGGNCTFSVIFSEFFYRGALPGHFVDVGSGWVGNVNNQASNLAVKYSTGDYVSVPGILKLNGGVHNDFNNTDDPDEIGIRFQVSVRYRVTGVWASCRSTGDFDIVLYDTDGTTELLSFSHDAGFAGGTTDASKARLYHWSFDSTAILEPDVYYRLVFRPTTATDVRLHGGNNFPDGNWDTWPGGQLVHKTQQSVAGVWTQDTTRRMFIGPVVNGIDVAAARLINSSSLVQ